MSPNSLVMNAQTSGLLRRCLYTSPGTIPTRPFHSTLRLASTTRTTTKTSKFSAYTTRLNALSARTGVSLPSLALSFGILHEVTALVPLLILFFGFQAANVGASIVQWAGEVTEESEHDHGKFNWRVTVGDWLAEGERRVDKVARRYGLFGYEKGSKAVLEGGQQAEEEAKQLALAAKGSKAAADVTNAIAAYVLVKALLPARIGFSLAFAPAFSRRIFDPTRRFVWHGVLRRPKTSSQVDVK